MQNHKKSRCRHQIFFSKIFVMSLFMSSFKLSFYFYFCRKSWKKRRKNRKWSVQFCNKKKKKSSTCTCCACASSYFAALEQKNHNKEVELQLGFWINLDAILVSISFPPSLIVRKPPHHSKYHQESSGKEAIKWGAKMGFISTFESRV